MFLTADSRADWLPFAYFVLALVCAGILGWLVAGRGAGDGAVRVLYMLAVAGGIYLSVRLATHAARRVTARRLASVEEKLHESDALLRQAQKMEAVGQLAGGIAHDFNNLVTVIGCSVGLLTDATEPSDPRQEDLGQIKEAAERAASLTRQLLAFSRRQIMQPRPLDLNNVVRDMERMIGRVIGTHITVHTALDQNLGLVLADVGQMEQVLMNLAVNARDAMPASGTLTFATANRTIRMPEPHRHGMIEPGDYVTLTVRDTGHGMPPHVLEHVFEPFFTTKEQDKGTGLGLATVHGIVYQSGGHITVESAVGVGTTFTLFFPRITSAAKAEVPKPEIRFPDNVLIPTGTGSHICSILVVDDEPAIREITSRLLRQAGFRVLTAGNGRDALALLRHEHATGNSVHLVLTDVVMPIMHGRALTKTIAKEFPDVRILFMSAYTRDDLHRHYKIDETVRLVSKPFEVGEMITAVRQTMPKPPGMSD